MGQNLEEIGTDGARSQGLFWGLGGIELVDPCGETSRARAHLLFRLEMICIVLVMSPLGEWVFLVPFPLGPIRYPQR